MKKIISQILLFSLFFFTLTILIVPSVSAKIIAGKEFATIAESDVIDDDVFIAADTVTVDGTINGDLYAAGGTVSVRGTVNGDVIATGGMVTISGTVTDDIRAAGGMITITNATVGDSITVFGGNVRIDQQTTVEGGVTFGTGNLSIEGNIGRGMTGGGGNVMIDGTIGKDVIAGIGNLTLGPNADIAGSLHYYSEDTATIEDTATVSGGIKQVVPPVKKPAAKQFKKELAGIKRGFKLGFKLWSYLASLLVGFVLLYLFPQAIKSIAENVRQKTLLTAGVGFLKLIATPVAFILLLISVIGVPLAFILFALFIIELYIAKIFVSYALGGILFEFFGNKKVNQYGVFGIGLLAYYALTMLPIIRFFTILITVVLGLGGLFLFKKNLITKGRK